MFELTCIEPLTSLGVCVPDQEICALVRDDSQEIPIFIPSKTAAHSGQADSIEDLGMTVVDVHHLVVT